MGVLSSAYFSGSFEESEEAFPVFLPLILPVRPPVVAAAGIPLRLVGLTLYDLLLEFFRKFTTEGFATRPKLGKAPLKCVCIGTFEGIGVVFVDGSARPAEPGSG